MHLIKPANFSFKNTINSHGWSELLPFEIDAERGNLSYVFADEGFRQPIAATISAGPKQIRIKLTDKTLTQPEREIVREKVRHLLRLDEEFSSFYELTKKNREFTWIEEKKVGRLMRSPTVFEDLVKTICTTNCTWSLTRKMVTNLVEKLGSEAAGGEKAFPTAGQMAAMDEEFYREEIRAGYRSAYLAELAQQTAAGKIDPESWLSSDLPTGELKKELKKVKGVGDYAAENLLKLLGRYDGLALDSFLKSEFYKKRNRNEVCSDREIRDFYQDFGQWQGLAIWFDMTRRWFA